MDQKKARRAVCVMLCTVVLACTPVANLLVSKPIVAAIFFLETGKILRTPPASREEPPQTSPPQLLEPTQPAEKPPKPVTPEVAPGFSPEDARLVQVQSYCGYETDVPAWLATPLSWNLQQTQPTVLILHSHATEGYENTPNYRSQNREENVVSIGDALTQRLEAAGIRVIHDRELHDYPSYNDSYENSRAAAKKYLTEYPSILLVLDLHRDAVEDSDGNQIKYTVQTPTGAAARIMLVVGTDAGGLTHGKWPENMSLAVKFQAQLEKIQPGICRPISFRSQRFNQDLSTGALLVEMGSAGNTRQEALLTVQYLAEAIIALANGTE